MKTKYVSEFRFNKALYNVGDGKDVFLLEVDYKNNKFEILGNSISKKFKQEVSNIAKALLEKKHGVNFAQKRVN